MVRSSLLAVSLFASLACTSLATAAAQTVTPPVPVESPIENAFQLGLIVQDTNGDKIADAICGRVLVPNSSSAAENTSAANLAARLGFETTALSLPIVTASSTPAKSSCAQPMNFWVGRQSISGPGSVDDLLGELQIGEGGVFALPGGLLVAGSDEAGLLAAANAYAAHAPFQWSVSAEKLEAIARILNARLKDGKIAATVSLIGLTYQGSQPGIHRAIVEVTGSSDRAAIRAALLPPEGESPLQAIAIRELELRFPNAAPLNLAVAGRPVQPSQPATPAPPSEETRLLDLRTLYGIKGLLTGTPKKLVPESVAAKLYVAAGGPGIAMANLAARIVSRRRVSPFPSPFRPPESTRARSCPRRSLLAKLHSPSTPPTFLARPEIPPLIRFFPDSSPRQHLRSSCPSKQARASFT